MDFDTAIGQAWADHGDDARGVAARWPALRAFVGDEPQLERLVGLTLHVHGLHLGDWAGGRAALEALRTLAAYRDDAGSGAAVRRGLASLALCAGAAADAATLSPSDQVRVHAMAGESLSGVDPARSIALVQQAAALAEQHALPDSDPAQRTIAATTHNIAAALEENTARSADERALMILAAQTSRRHWERAGTWLEVERAEYRLAMTWLQAGDAAQARRHAQACLDIVAAHDGAALERFFAWEALGRAAESEADRASALRAARAAFGELAADDQAWCRDSLDRLAALR